MSGYAGTDFQTFAGFDWEWLKEATREIARHCRRVGIWAVIGSAHRLSGSHKPHNSLYVISDAGHIVERYDKRFCSGDPDGRSGDLAHYSPGSHSSTWEIDGIRCGALICYDYRYPELYREYGRRGVRLVFHNVPGVLISAADTGQELYDSTAAWRERAMSGTLHGGTLVSDPRSDDRTRA